MQTTTVFGIPNCDTVKKARVWLQAQGIDFHFHDFKKAGLTAEQVLAWSEQVSWETLLNRRGTTWRALPPETQAKAGDARSAAQLMAEHPSLVKRPVVVWPNGAVTVGFSAEDWQTRVSQPH